MRNFLLLGETRYALYLHTEAFHVDERLVFLEGTLVYLKVPTRSDVEESDWVGWFNNADVSRYNLHHYYPVTLDTQLEFVDTCNSPTKLQLAVVDRADDSVICGMVSLSAINLIHRNAELAVIMDNRRTAQNPKLVLEAWALILRHGFEQFGLEKIYGGTFHPQIARVLERAFGFEIEGVRKRHVYKNDEFHDVTLFAVHRDEVRYPAF